MLLGEQVVVQGGSDATNVQRAGGTGSKTDSNWFHKRITDEWGLGYGIVESKTQDDSSTDFLIHYFTQQAAADHHLLIEVQQRDCVVDKPHSCREGSVVIQAFVVRQVKRKA